MKIDLELLNESDFEQIIHWVNRYSEDFIIQWAGLTYKYPLTLTQMKDHYRNGINSFESDVFIYKIINDKRFIGTVQICRFNIQRKEAAIGRFLIGEEHDRGKGIGKIALNELVRVGFNDFGLNIIKLNVFDFNVQAINCYRAIGFRQSNYWERTYQDQDGQWWNNKEMSLKKEEWLD